MSGENFRLDREIDAAKLLRAGLGEMIKDDPELAADMIEGETNLNEAIQAAVDRYAQDKCAVEAIKAHIELLQSRRARIEKRMALTRDLVCVALDQAGRKSVDTPLGTACLKRVPPGMNIDKEREGEIPPEYWKRGDPVLDKAKLKAALQEGKTISGAALNQGGVTVSFSFK